MAQGNQSDRRSFLQQASSVAILASLASRRSQAAQGEIEQRSFGRHDEMVSSMCLGGFHIGTLDRDEDAIRMVRESIDQGMTFMDNAWEYHNGRSEELMGRALQDGYRDKAFVMTKHHGRDKKTAMKHLEDSLRRLKTDVIDLWQFHEIVYEADAGMIFDENGGGIEAAYEAKEQGKVRYIGFTGHKEPKYFLKMLSYDFEWDAVQMPLNPFDPHYRSFEKEVLPILTYRGIAALAMKSLGGGWLLRTNTVTAKEAMHYALSLPVSTLVTGIDSFDLLEENLNIGRSFKPMTASEKKALLARTQEVASTGDHEPFKSTNMYDGPVGRELHGVG